MTDFWKGLGVVSALVVAPVASSAAVVTPTFVDGMTISIPAGLDVVRSFEMDLCAGVTDGNCYSHDYDTGAPVAYVFIKNWQVSFLDIVGDLCGDDLMCFDIVANVETVGTWDMAFDVSFQRRAYLGGDEYGSEFVYTSEGFQSHPFVLEVTAPVPLPPAALGMGLGLLALFSAGWSRRQTAAAG